MIGPAPPAESRRAFLSSLPTETSTSGATPQLKFMHLPASHAKALFPGVMLVVGMRGAGKSFWWSALQSAAHRRLLDVFAPDLGLEDATVVPGFGGRADPAQFPTRPILADLLTARIPPRDIWRTVALYHLAPDAHPLRNLATWKERAAHVSGHVEEMERLLKSRDEEYDAQGRYWILVFDAMDLSASDWPTMHHLIRGVLQLAVDLRAYKRLRLKCFLRTDQYDATAIANFPDASKILAERVELSWPDRELYNLMWQHLGNAEGRDGEVVREVVQKALGKSWRETHVDEQTVWRPPVLLIGDDARQRDAVHAFTGPWMGSDRRRGFPYTWIPGHLADGQGQVSPRSFLAALREAAQDTQERYPDHAYALHYESIKRGSREASEIRVNELREDYEWVEALLQPLTGIVVPCDFSQIQARWTTSRAFDRVSQADRLPPSRLSEGPAGVRSNLEQLGLFVRMSDDRVNIPDVFRLGYGIGRRGGVRPVQRHSER